MKSILHLNVLEGTGKLAQFGDSAEWGKTGTTENNGDAWFCGGDEHFTACVWVGHADSTTPMTTDYNGGPVDGGTYPALIWGRIMSSIESIYRQHKAEANNGDSSSDSSSSDSSSSTYTPSYSGSSSSSSSSSSGTGGGGGGGNTSAPRPRGRRRWRSRRWRRSHGRQHRRHWRNRALARQRGRSRPTLATAATRSDSP